MAIKHGATRVDRGYLDGDIGVAGLGLLVQRDGAGRVIEAAALLRETQMGVFEAGKGVGRVDVVSHGLGQSGSAQGGDNSAEDQVLFHEDAPSETVGGYCGLMYSLS